MKFGSNIDLCYKEIQFARFHNVTADVDNPLVGQFWYRTDTGDFVFFGKKGIQSFIDTNYFGNVYIPQLDIYLNATFSAITHNHNLAYLSEKSYNSLDDLPSLNFEPANANIQSHIGDGNIHVTTVKTAAWDAKLDVSTVIPSLDTIDKRLTPAINEVNAIAKGAGNGETITDIEALVILLNAAVPTAYPYGKNFYVVDTEVPDYWISAIGSSSVPYVYVDDTTFLDDLAVTGSLQVGYYSISELESQKVDLTDYYDKAAADLLLGAKEDITNKSSNVDTDKTSTTKYANVKAIYDWAVGKFIDLTKIVTTWTATTLNTNVPSEKLVKDSLDLKSNLADGNTFSGNQNFDSNTLFVDSVNHRVGVGTITPTYKLDVRGTAATDGIRSCMGIDIYPVPNPIAPALIEMTSGGLVDVGDHYYACTYMTALGETNKGVDIKITVTSPNQTVKIGVPISSDPRVTARRIFRTKSGSASYNEYLLAVINDNTTSEYIDIIADSALTGSARPVYTRMNTTTNQITLNGVRALFIDFRNTIIGLAAGSKITTGGANFLAGFNAGGALTTGSENVAILGLGGLATGVGNVGIGAASLLAAVTTAHCVGIGYYTLRYCTGNFNVGIGSSVLGGITTATFVVGLGYGAGTFIADGTTAKQTGNYGIYIGANTKALSNGTENEVVIGYDAIGNGSNTMTLGNNNIADTYLKGRTHVTSSIQINNDTASASAANAGAIRYRADANNSYVEMCMQTGASTYAWVVIKQNTW